MNYHEQSKISSVQPLGQASRTSELSWFQDQSYRQAKGCNHPNPKKKQATLYFVYVTLVYEDEIKQENHCNPCL